MVNWISSKAMISSCMAGHSYLTQLQELVHQWTNTLECGFLDFCKVFDSVHHRRLLLKLDYTGVGGNRLKWIQAFPVASTSPLVFPHCLHRRLLLKLDCTGVGGNLLDRIQAFSVTSTSPLVFPHCLHRRLLLKLDCTGVGTTCLSGSRHSQWQLI